MIREVVLTQRMPPGQIDPHVGRPIENVPGLTVEERESFSQLLKDADLIDAFRQKHPEASGVFSYYSQRIVQNRPMNRGLRLDYVLASPSLKLADAFILSTDEAWPFADHSPVGAVFELD